MIRIRRTDNTAEIAELDRLYISGTPLSDVELEDSQWWIAEEHNIVLGFCGARIVNDECFLIRSAVCVGARGRGLQKRFIRLRIRWARAQGVSRAHTYVHVTNIPSMRSLINCGFRPFKYEDSFVHFSRLTTR